MKRLVSGEDAYPLNFRDGDSWTELADNFNQLREELIELRNAPKAPADGIAITPRKKLFNDEQPSESAEGPVAT